jgi:hypothetical protein
VRDESGSRLRSLSQEKCRTHEHNTQKRNNPEPLRRLKWEFLEETLVVGSHIDNPVAGERKQGQAEYKERVRGCVEPGVFGNVLLPPHFQAKKTATVEGRRAIYGDQSARKWPPRQPPPRDLTLRSDGVMNV